MLQDDIGHDVGLVGLRGPGIFRMLANPMPRNRGVVMLPRGSKHPKLEASHVKLAEPETFNILKDQMNLNI